MRKLENRELNRKSVEEFKQTSKMPVTVVLDNIRSLNNIGSIFRTSDAFLVERMILCGITACPPHNDIRKTALGADEAVDWFYAENILEILSDFKTRGYTLIAIEQAESAVMLNEFQISENQKYVLIFGNEVKGVQQSVVDLCDFCIEIPQGGTKHSLNVSVSAGAVLWEFFKQFSDIQHK